MAASLASTPYPVNARSRPPARNRADSMQIARALISSSSACALEVLAARDRYRCDYATSRRSSPYTSWLATLQRVPSFECYDLAHFEFIMLVRAGSGGRSLRGSFGYEGVRVVGSARARYVERPESAPLASQAGSRCPFIHSYPQVFPHPQPTHMLGISGSAPPTRGG